MHEFYLLIKRARYCLAEGLHDKAIENLSEAITLDCKNIKPYLLRAKAYRAKAEAQAFSMPPDFGETTEWKEDYQRLQELALAIQDAVVATTLCPESHEALYELAMAYFDKGNYRLAIKVFDKCMALAPRDIKTFYWREVAYGEIEEDEPYDDA